MRPFHLVATLAIMLPTAAAPVAAQGAVSSRDSVVARPHGVEVSCSECAFSPFEATFKTPPTVISVDKGSPADKAGIRVNDRIVAIGDHAITTPDGGAAFVRAIGKVPQRWTVERDGRRVTLTIKVD